MTALTVRRIAVWSGPRNLSTALMRSFSSRPDCVVSDEPFYACYLNQHPLEHPGRNEVIASQSTDWREVAQQLTLGPPPLDRPVWYQKHMAHHMRPEMLGDWLDHLDHAMLIRHPGFVIQSYHRVVGDMGLAETGLSWQWRLLEHLQQTRGITPAVVDASQLRHNPEQTLRGLCATLGLDPRINRLGCTLIILAEHKPPVYDNQSGVTLITAGHRRPFAEVLDQRIHSCNQLTSILAKIEANMAGADDALMLDTAGMLAETNATHVFLVRRGIVITSTTRACPEGITRAAVLELCEQHGQAAEVRDVPAEELLQAEEMFVTGTMGEITPVARLDQHTFAPIPGPITARIAAWFRELTTDPSQGTRVVSD